MRLEAHTLPTLMQGADCPSPTPLAPAQDLDWRFAAAQEEMNKASSSADEGDAKPSAAETKPSAA